jgi:hypothetical protein
MGKRATGRATWRAAVAAMAVGFSVMLASALGHAQGRKPGEPPPPPETPAQGPPGRQAPESIPPARTVGLAPFEAEAPPWLTVLFGPFFLSAPVLRLNGEIALADKLGAVVILGVGKPRVIDPGSALEAPVTTRAWLLEAGGQLRYYPLGSFTGGAVLGLDASYVAIDSDQLLDVGVSNTTAGLGVAPVVGFKLVTRLGFTIDITAGPRILVFKPTPSRVTPDDLADKPRRALVLFNAQVGWTF